MQMLNLYLPLLTLFCLFQKNDGFLPNNGLNLILTLLDMEIPTGTLTHGDISEEAIVQVARDVLLDNPNPNPILNSTDRLISIGGLTTSNLIEAYFGAASRNLVGKFEEAIEEIRIANENVDFISGMKELAAAHFASERFQEGQNLLVRLRHLVLITIEKGDYSVARKVVGRFLHTLQDFYSHSNWVEMGNTEPYSALGESNQNPVNIVPPTTSTCIDCKRGDLIRFVLGLSGAEFYYTCQNNIRGGINQAQQLTSGYDTGMVDVQGVTIVKPTGKCSHGGLFDSSSDETATGGINKDSTSPSYSPHADLHLQAASIAIKASVAYLSNLRSQVNNDTKFLDFLNIKLGKQTVASIAYVIDTTGSMGAELPEIQATIPTIRSDIEEYITSLGPNAEVNFILVPYNDPDPGTMTKTTDIDAFLAAIGSLTASGGGDCPEPSIGATIRAIQASEPNSHIFVYTDAEPSDAGRYTELQDLILETSAKVSYVLTGTCGLRKRRSTNDKSMVNTVRSRRQTASDDIYLLIAAYSGGQVLNVETSSISELSSVIFQSTQSSFIQILLRRGTNTISQTFTFPVDETISSITITLNGISISNRVTLPGGIDLNSLDPASDLNVAVNTSLSFIADVKISDNNLYGVWTLEFSSTGTYSIQVSATSSLRFLYQLYQFDSQSQFGYTNIEGNPTQGQTLILLINTAVENKGINFTSVNLINADGVAVQFLNLTKTNTNSFGSLFIPTLEIFRLEIIGVDSIGNPVRRFSDTGVQISDVDLRLANGSSQDNTLYPGNSSNITLILSNYGEGSTFQINIANSPMSSNFDFSSSHTELTVATNATAEMVLTVTASNDTTDGDTISFTVTALTNTMNIQRSNFVTFSYIVSTLPPANQTENMLAAATMESVNSLLLFLLLLANAFLLF